MGESIGVSLIILIYNVEKFIERCLLSAFQQSFVDIEFILVDDCSTDFSVEVAKAVINQFGDRKIKIIHHKKNQGSAAARKSALKVASGSFVIFLDGDDYVESNMIERMYERALYENADIVVADYYVNYPKRQLYCRQEIPSNGILCAQWMLDGRLHSSTCNKLVKRNLYLEYGISFTVGIDMWEDLSVMPRLCFFAKKVVHLPEGFLHYVQYNPTSYTSRMHKPSIEDMQQVIKMLEEFFENEGVGKEFEEALNFRKLIAKGNFILHTRGVERKKLSVLYPEANSCIGRHPSLSLFYRSIVWLGIHNLYKSIDVLFGGYCFLKRFYLRMGK